jgi:hypothetical protein
MTEPTLVPGESPLSGGNFRAEDLTKEQLTRLTVMSEREQEIVRALESGGQRLLIGPRGSGKSTYLKLAYYEALDGDRVLPVYVNYSRSISLEPEFRKSARALPLFRQWVLAQIVHGLRTSLDELDLEIPDEQEERFHDAADFVSAIERQRVSEAAETTFDVTQVLQLLADAGATAGRRRVVLLLDDAAHAFAAEQQREFFEIFASLRSRWVSSKAAVYPGVTSYTPRFHIGHDAQLIDVWLRPDQSGYVEMMREIAQKRLTTEEFAQLDRRDGLLEYLALASFGIPRTLILMLAQISEETDSNRLSATKAISDSAIEDAAENAMKVFTSLEAKLPRYRNFVAVGNEFVTQSLEAIRKYNDARASSGQDGRANRIWIEEPVPSEVQRIFGFLEYAGVVRQQGTSVSQGGRSYRVLVPHYGLLVSHTALGLGRNPSIASGISALSSRQHAARVRRTLPSLLGSDYQSRCRLDLGQCANCGTQRENPEARFCANCGAQLSQASVFEELLDTDINALPLTAAILSRVRDHSDLRKIKHIIVDEENQRLLEIPYIGPHRASRIRLLAEEFVYE